MKNQIVIVMGVSGCGKTSVADKLARLCEVRFLDGDDFHPRRNVDKMWRDDSLDDDDRQPWLERVSDAIYSLQKRKTSAFIACSALKRKYRDQIRYGNAAIRFLFLDGSYETIFARMNSRPDHYMSPSALQGQFDALERPHDEPDVFTIGIEESLDEIVNHAAAILGLK